MSTTTGADTAHDEFAYVIPALAVLNRASELREESNSCSNQLPWESLTDAQKAPWIGRAWAERAGWRPPARVVSTREELNTCNDDAVLHWLDDAGLPHTAFAFRLRENSNVWPTTVIHEGGAL